LSNAQAAAAATTGVLRKGDREAESGTTFKISFHLDGKDFEAFFKEADTCADLYKYE